MTKPVVFCGGSLQSLRRFPKRARQDAGFQLDKVQRGNEPDDWKPMRTIGAGVREIRIRDSSGAFRIIYVATLADAVYVLHCFQKKSGQTALVDIRIARSRMQELIGEMR
jgi:phage-related protein